MFSECFLAKELLSSLDILTVTVIDDTIRLEETEKQIITDNRKRRGYLI